MFSSQPKPSPFAACFASAFIWLIAVGTGAGIGAAGAAIMVSVAPQYTASLVAPTLCPPGATASLKTIYGATYRDSDNITRREQTLVLQCADAQGAPITGAGQGFGGLWYGAWITAGVLAGTLLASVWLILAALSAAKRRQGAAPPRQLFIR